MNAECLFTPIPKSVQSNTVPKLVVATNVLTPLESSAFGLLAERDDDAFDDER